MNVEVRRANGVPFPDNIRDGTILPLVWIESEVDELPESVRKVLYRGHYLVNAVEAGFQWCSLIALVLFSGALIAEFKRNETPNREIVCAALSRLPPRSG